VEWVRRRREEGRELRREMEERDREVQEQERYNKVQRSRWNRWYKEVRTMGVPKYLREEGKEGRMSRTARFIGE